ncbi:hypothetical protein NBH19_25500 [Rhizobium sp. S95]|uniref:Uncharacterized protein n=1 Tax=Ciceribacter sichuanensis TaxID=2949647 RepID=A0AAJ1C121_9HYPH|nr:MULTISPECIES: hypothetical protein [unclassified Ciceribacter]MCM2399446.1 hypothetical protein [Ciceribacter sp. S95]MCO5959762.1 hypothetical protein [Ciceribacter sp. S101]
MTGTSENTATTAADNTDEPDPVRACIAQMTADALGVPRICLRRACRRQRRCGIWLQGHDETDCAALLPEKSRALYDALRVEAEVIIDQLKERRLPPPPSPDPGQHWLQEQALRIVLGTLAHFRVAGHPILRRVAGNWRAQEPALLQGAMLQRYEALMRIASAEPDRPATEAPSFPDETIGATTLPPAGEPAAPPGPPSADAS